MQQGCRSYYTPKKLTKALNLKTSIQQDAQEYVHIFPSCCSQLNAPTLLLLASGWQHAAIIEGLVTNGVLCVCVCVCRFYKLFLDYLEERFRQSSNESVKNLARQFQGEYAYTTVCQACKNVSQRKCQFSELELNLKVWDSELAGDLMTRSTFPHYWVNDFLNTDRRPRR
jgi:hypothetical protein